MTRRATRPGSTSPGWMSSRSPWPVRGRRWCVSSRVAEFAAAIGVGTETGKHYLGHALELRYRLPKLWARVTSGELAAWKARLVAGRDHQPRPHRRGGGVRATPTWRRWRTRSARSSWTGWSMRRSAGSCPTRPSNAAVRPPTDATSRSRRTRSPSPAPAWSTGELDLADALDLDDAIRGIAAQLADLGSTESLGCAAVGRRRGARPPPARPRPHHRPGETPASSAARREAPGPDETVLHLHLSQPPSRAHDPVGRVENTRSPVTAEQIRAWCGRPDTDLTVKPVIDLADHVHVDAYEVPDRIAEAVALRDHALRVPVVHPPRPQAQTR